MQQTSCNEVGRRSAPETSRHPGSRLHGRQAFRAALDGLGEILPPGFEITGLRQIEGQDEVVSIIEWKSTKIPASQLSALFKFKGDKIFEERWFVDTEQWKSAF